MATPILPGLAHLADRYDAFILDMWGVLHDGIAPYADAAATLAALKAAGKATVLLSNAPRRADGLIEMMDRLGLGRDLYGAVMSSGEAVYQELAAPKDPAFSRLGRTFYLQGPDWDRSLYQGLDFQPTRDPAAAEWVLNTGTDGPDSTMADYEPGLAACAARGLLMVCANPDLVVVRQGRRWLCAGGLAERYRDLGGPVVERGKPHPAVYDTCIGLLGRPDRRRVLCVGDSLRTDMAGAAASGLDAVLIAGGIHDRELGQTAYGQDPDPAQLAALCAAHGLAPTAALACFRW